MAQHQSYVVPVLPEVVQSQGLLPLVYKVYCLVRGVECQQREQRAEYLLLHDGAVLLHAVQHRGMDVALLAVVGAAYAHVAVLQVARQTLKGLVAHYAHKVLCLLRILAQQVLKLLLESLYQPFLHLGMHQQIVGRYARLSGIQALSPCYAACRHGYVGILVHYAGALTAQFQHHRSQMLRSGTHHPAAQVGTSRKEYYVVPLLQQGSVHLPVALHHGNVLRGEGLADHLLHHPGHVRHVGRRLQHRRASCRDGSHQWVQQQLHGIVPRSHYQRASQRFLHHLAPRGEHLQWSTHPLGRRPLAQVRDVVPNLSQHYAQFRQIGLLVTLVQVLPQGICQGLLPLLHGTLQRAQALLAKLHIQCLAATEELPLRLHYPPDLLPWCILHCHISLISFFP